jgi:hypothetical protein
VKRQMDLLSALQIVQWFDKASSMRWLLSLQWKQGTMLYVPVWRTFCQFRGWYMLLTRLLGSTKKIIILRSKLKWRNQVVWQRVPNIIQSKIVGSDHIWSWIRLILRKLIMWISGLILSPRDWLIPSSLRFGHSSCVAGKALLERECKEICRSRSDTSSSWLRFRWSIIQ